MISTRRVGSYFSLPGVTPTICSFVLWFHHETAKKPTNTLLYQSAYSLCDLRACQFQLMQSKQSAPDTMPYGEWYHWEKSAHEIIDFVK